MIRKEAAVARIKGAAQSKVDVEARVNSDGARGGRARHSLEIKPKRKAVF